MTHTELGIFGEDVATNFLVNKGVRILKRNYRFKKYELDIVGQLGETIIIYEVKTRETAQIGEPYKAVTRTKQRQIICAADQYIRENNLSCEVQFDIISIVHNSYRTKIEHIEQAFFPTP